MISAEMTYSEHVPLGGEYVKIHAIERIQIAER